MPSHQSAGNQGMCIGLFQCKTSKMCCCNTGGMYPNAVPHKKCHIQDMPLVEHFILMYPEHDRSQALFVGQRHKVFSSLH